MKKYTSILALCLCAAFLAGCTQNTEAEATTSAPPATTAPQTTTSPETETEATTTTEMIEEIDLTSLSDDEMLDMLKTLSTVTTSGETGRGDGHRLLRALEKAENDGELTVGFLGGSITEGYMAGTDLFYARRVYDWLCEEYPGASVNYVNAGLSGTPSIMGASRAPRDLLYTNEPVPDIIFLEYAVNDGIEEEYKLAYESLVRRFLDLPNQPAVILLFTVLENGYSAQAHMIEIGRHYDLPMISLVDSLTPFFEAGRLDWDTYSDDESHPNAWGHEMIAELIIDKIEILKSLGTDYPETPLPEEALFGTPYTALHFADRSSLDEYGIEVVSLGSFTEADGLVEAFPHNWETKGGTEPISFTITCDNLFIYFKCMNSARYGEVEIYVDDVKVYTINSSQSDGWGNAVAELVFTGGEVKERLVEIRLADDSEGPYFGLLGFGFDD